MLSTSRQASKSRIVVDASYIARIHTLLAYAAFSFALCIGCLLHYKKIVKNGVAGYPEEWFPSVSATIGDWYPERSIFQILIALTAGPRFALVLLQYYIHWSEKSSLPSVVFLSGLVRTISCGGWVYITSSDDHDAHDIFMITYMVCNIPWMLGGIACTPIQSRGVRRKRQAIAVAFFVSIIPLVYFFIQHKVHRIPGAYTRYSFFEWSLIFFDVLYDSATESEFKEAQLQIAIGPSLSSSPYTDQMKPNDPIAQPQVQPVTQGTSQKFVGCPSESVKSSTPRQKLWNYWISARPHVSFISDVYLSYIFWSIFTSLIPTLFYFSIWELGISGQELALLTTLSPIFLSISPLLTWARSHRGQATLHLLSLSGIAAYALNHPLHRLLVVAFANVVLAMRQTAEWAGVSDRPSNAYKGIVAGLGLLLSSLSKHANHSNNPLWPSSDEASGSYNKAGLALALLALYEFYHREREDDAPPSQRDTKSGTKIPEHCLSAALPLGSLLFCLHGLLSDSSTIIAWSWTGYENSAPRGPLPHLHGSLTLIAQAFGLLIPQILLSASPTATNKLAHPLWFCYGAAGSFAMLKYRNWLGYAGGLNVAVFFMSVIPHILQRSASTSSVGKTYFTAMLVYCLLTLASVWTVAYAFVPGGVYLRERTDLVVLAQMACLAPAFEWPSMRSRTLSMTLHARAKSAPRALLALISISSVLVTMYRWPSIAPRPFRPGPRIMRAGIWTVHFGFDNSGRDSQRLIRNVLRDLQLDVIGLLETDLHRPVYGNRDLTRVIIEDLGYYVDLGPGPNSHTWGAVLLSKFPIINSTHHLLPSPHGELAPAIEAILDVYGTEVTVVVAHNGQEEDALDRELQSKELARIMSASYPRPVIFLGYIVTKPHAPRPNPYEIMVADGRVHDIDQDDHDRWCEYIFYRGVYRTSYARVSRGIVTDTELQVGQFVVPKPGFPVTNDTAEARYIRSQKEILPTDHWFPMEYYGSGVNGHFYHVFGTPLYYQLPHDVVV